MHESERFFPQTDRGHEVAASRGAGASAVGGVGGSAIVAQLRTDGDGSREAPLRAFVTPLIEVDLPKSGQDDSNTASSVGLNRPNRPERARECVGGFIEASQLAIGDAKVAEGNRFGIRPAESGMDLGGLFEEFGRAPATSVFGFGDGDASALVTAL